MRAQPSGEEVLLPLHLRVLLQPLRDGALPDPHPLPPAARRLARLRDRLLRPGGGGERLHELLRAAAPGGQVGEAERGEEGEGAGGGAGGGGTGPGEQPTTDGHGRARTFTDREEVTAQRPRRCPCSSVIPSWNKSASQFVKHGVAEN